MSFGNFYNEHQKIIIVVLLLIIAFIVYRYFWEQKSITKDLSISNLKNRIDYLENTVGINPSFQPNTNTPTIPGQTPQPICLDQTTQKQIANDINNKLKEINSCDCRETCAMYNSTNNTGNMGIGFGNINPNYQISNTNVPSVPAINNTMGLYH
jgi:hypothetical protein